MSNLDTLYRAFADFRKITSDDHDCEMQRNAVARTDSNNDFVETVRYTCHIDEDWVEAIERGMEFVEKAIAEERQFIRNNGEVVPIEKVKRVSRDSVEHLAKHSGLITKEPPKGQTVIPDQLYTVERLSDFAVYENRFLYMLLKYLEQFISLRYNKIVELANTYRGKMNIDKNLKTSGQSVTFKVELAEERRNDPLLSELNPNKSIIERIAMLLKMVVHYLSTPLMLEVSKSPMLRPPITVTNVLRMNHNFNGAMRLYEFVSSYDKPGYSAEKQVKKISPFPDIPADEFAEIEALSSYLTYQYGMGVKEILRDAYNAEEERRKEEAERKKLEKLAALRKRILENGGNPEEYMLLLESRNRTLELDSAQLAAARNEIERLNAEINKLNAHASELNSTVDEQSAEIARLNAKYEQDMAELKAAHEQNIAALNAAHEDEMRAAEELHENKLAEQAALHAEEMEKARAELQAQIDDRDDVINKKNDEILQVKNDCQAEIKRIQDECDGVVADKQRLVDEKEKQRLDVLDENKLLTELKMLSDARLNAVKYKHGYMTPADDYTSELAFNEIELQYNIFKDFFKKVWRQTKKRIRKEIAEKLNENEKQAKAKQSASDTAEQQTQSAEQAEQTADDAREQETPSTEQAEQTASEAAEQESQSVEDDMTESESNGEETKQKANKDE